MCDCTETRDRSECWVTARRRVSGGAAVLCDCACHRRASGRAEPPAEPDPVAFRNREAMKWPEPPAPPRLSGQTEDHAFVGWAEKPDYKWCMAMVPDGPGFQRICRKTREEHGPSLSGRKMLGVRNLAGEIMQRCGVRGMSKEHGELQGWVEARIIEAQGWPPTQERERAERPEPSERERQAREDRDTAIDALGALTQRAKALEAALRGVLPIAERVPEHNLTEREEAAVKAARRVLEPEA